MATPSEPRRSRPVLGTACLVGAVILMATFQGCGRQAQVNAGNRELILRLATGASTRDRAIMDRASGEVARLAANKTLTDEEGDAFRSILDAARAEDWDLAQDLAYALRDGQQPTSEDRERLAKRPMREVKKLRVGRAAR